MWVSLTIKASPLSTLPLHPHTVHSALSSWSTMELTSTCRWSHTSHYLSYLGFFSCFFMRRHLPLYSFRAEMGRVLCIWRQCMVASLAPRLSFKMVRALIITSGLKCQCQATSVHKYLKPVRCVGAFVMAGGEIDCVDKDGNTPLHIAARYGHELLINTLITSGADCTRCVCFHNQRFVHCS